MELLHSTRQRAVKAGHDASPRHQPRDLKGRQEPARKEKRGSELAVTSRESGHVLGCVALSLVDFAQFRSAGSYGLVPDARGQGARPPPYD